MARPKALIVGGGSKFGEAFAKLASSDYEVHVVTGSQSEADRVINIDWNTVNVDDILSEIDKSYDLILFNQNGGGSPNGVDNESAYYNYTQPLEHWNRGFFNNVQLPYYILRHCQLLRGNKICWMLTPLMSLQLRDFGKIYGGYAADKSYNSHMVKSFSYYSDASFYGMVPKHFGDSDQFSTRMYDVIKNLDLDLSGNMIDENGDIWKCS